MRCHVSTAEIALDESRMKEIEIKLAAPTAAWAQGELARLGALAQGARSFEDNRVYDQPDGRLRGAGQLLRLRSAAGRHLLTFKEAPNPATADSGYKIREEFEMAVTDPDRLDRALRAIAYEVQYRYQKWRQSFRLGELKIELDETPLGVFIELEGVPAEIDAAAGRLGFGRGDYITATYRELQQRIKGESEPGDLLFSSP